MWLLVRKTMKKCKLILIFLIFILVQSYWLSKASCSINSSTDDWTTFRHDSDHSGCLNSNSSMDSAKLLWTYATGRMVQSSPAVANGCVFGGCRDGQVYCLNASSGGSIWKFQIGSEVWSSPTIYNGCIYIGVDDGWICTLNVTTGMPIWASKIGGAVRSSPVIANGNVYIGSGDHGVFCLNASDGTTIWGCLNSYRVQSSPAVSNGVVFVTADNYCTYALNATTGNEIWSCHTGSTISSPSVYNGYVYLGASYDGNVFCLNASTGAQIWKYQTDGVVTSSPAVGYGCVYIGSDDNYVYCLNASNGQKIWRSPTSYSVTSSPAVAYGNVYVGSKDYNIYCFNAFTGSKEWSYPTGNFVESSPAVSNDTLYVGSDDKNVYAFSLYNATAESLPLQSKNNLAWTTIAFDAIAGTLAAIFVFSIARFVRSNKRTKPNAQPTNISSQNVSWFSAHTDLVCILAILAFSTIFFINLGKGVLWVADEQTYSQWAFHMVKNGDYLTPWAFGDVTLYIAKPPLNMWLMSLAYQVFGVSNFSTRIWSPIFGSLSLVLVFYLGKKLYNRYVGFLSALVLGTFTTFCSFARHAMTDVPFVFFIVASLYFFILSEKKEKTRKYAALSGLFFGLALMTKQTEALLIPLIIFIYLIATKRNIKFLFTKQLSYLLGVGLLLFSPWLIFMSVRFGSDFWQNYFVYSTVTRTISPIEGHAGSYLFYFSYLANNEMWWAILLPFAVGLCVFNSLIRRLKEDTLILTWMLIVLAIFTFAQTKLFWYILPAFPAFAIAIANLLYQLSKTIFQRYPNLNHKRRLK